MSRFIPQAVDYIVSLQLLYTSEIKLLRVPLLFAFWRRLLSYQFLCVLVYMLFQKKRKMTKKKIFQNINILKEELNILKDDLPKDFWELIII